MHHYKSFQWRQSNSRFWSAFSHVSFMHLCGWEISLKRSWWQKVTIYLVFFFVSSQRRTKFTGCKWNHAAICLLAFAVPVHKILLYLLAVQCDRRLWRNNSEMHNVPLWLLAEPRSFLNKICVAVESRPSFSFIFFKRYGNTVSWCMLHIGTMTPDVGLFEHEGWGAQLRTIKGAADKETQVDHMGRGTEGRRGGHDKTPK